MASDYPEHDKIMSRTAEHNTVQDFITYMDVEGYSVITRDGREIYSSDLVAGYFEVDPVKFEQEKRLMLERIRNGQ